MAFEESCASIGDDEEGEVTIVSASSLKKRKRSLRILPENTSTPYSAAKKSRLQRLDGPQRPATPMPKVTFTTSIMRITRGVQTMAPPEMKDRQTQVSVVPKKQFTVAVQTESNLRCGTDAIACQTSIDDLVRHEEACVGTSQSYPPEKPPQNDAACQTTATAVVPEVEEEPSPEQAVTLMMLATSTNNERCQQTTTMSTTGDELTDTLMRREILQRIAQSYGIDLSSGAERSPLENNKQSKKKKKKNKDRQHQDEVAAREQLLNATCDTVMTKVDEKLSTLIAGHLDQYRRQMVQHRQRYLSWIQEQKARSRSPAVRRKPIGKQNDRIERSSVSLEEKAVQCDPLPAALSLSQGSSQRVSVATQWYRQRITRSKVVKPKAVKAKEDSIKPIQKPPTISTDSKKPPAGHQDHHPEPEPSRRQSLRQTKLPLYVESRPTTGGDQRGRKGKHTPEQPANQSAVLAAAAATNANGDTSTARKRGKSAKHQPPSPVPPEPQPEPEHVEETPSEASDECRNEERKHYPYRVPPPVYHSQCSKSTATFCPTQSQLCSQHHHHHHHRQHQAAPQHYHPVRYANDEATPDCSLLLSPLKQMCVGGTRGCSGHCTNNFGIPPGSYLQPPMDSESISPTQPAQSTSSMMYVNRSQPRVLIRTKGSSNHVRTREKPAPEVNIISSQELYTQIGRAVENAFRVKALPTLATMYGEPIIETFNAIDEEEEEDEENSENPSFVQRKMGQPRQYRPVNQFVCSSGKDTVAGGGVARPPPRAPFYPGRSPSLSPIIYEDDSDEDGL